MVTINFTIFVETGLFLIFTGLMYVFVLRPLLRTVDGRENKMADDEKSAHDLQAQAGEVESEYVQQLADAHRLAAQTFSEGKRTAKQQHDEEIAAIRAAGANELATLLKELRTEVRQQRTASDAVVADIKHALIKKFGVTNGGLS